MKGLGPSTTTDQDYQSDLSDVAPASASTVLSAVEPFPDQFPRMSRLGQ